MISLSLNLSRLSVPAFIEEVRRIVGMMTGNASFATPLPTLASITLAVNQLEQNYQDGLGGSHTAKHLQKLGRLNVNSLMQQLKAYVQNTSGTNETVALSSGMSLKRRPEKHFTIGQPLNVRGKITANTGEAVINWKAVPNRKTYQLYRTSDLADITNQSKWTLLGSTGAIRYVTDGLTVGTKYGFMVVAIGSRSAKSAPSDPAIVTAA